jgi:hypothetical protein
VLQDILKGNRRRRGILPFNMGWYQARREAHKPSTGNKTQGKKMKGKTGYRKIYILREFLSCCKKATTTR